MLEGILPESASVTEIRGDIADATLFAEEKEAISGAVEKRRREFRTGRACARSALAGLGLGCRAIPSGPRGAPQWPSGVVGSITHCDGFRAAAVARVADLATIGIDAEVDAPLPRGVLADIALPEERPSLEALALAEPGVNWDRLLFSIKESVYKAWFPLAERWLGFEDARVWVDRRRGSFVARLLVPGPSLAGRELNAFSGRWLARDGLLLAAIGMPVGTGQTASRVGAGGAVGED
ncbi:MAG TPA: 4'-phosphopantetheinyl transferase superfamily protein [Solirubrobacterales bacterium]|jgi:4'-phosphopantetheinyl transferase EntD